MESSATEHSTYLMWMHYYRIYIESFAQWSEGDRRRRRRRVSVFISLSWCMLGTQDKILIIICCSTWNDYDRFMKRASRMRYDQKIVKMNWDKSLSQWPFGDDENGDGTIGTLNEKVQHKMHDMRDDMQFSENSIHQNQRRRRGWRRCDGKRMQSTQFTTLLHLQLGIFV